MVPKTGVVNEALEENEMPPAGTVYQRYCCDPVAPEAVNAALPLPQKLVMPPEAVMVGVV